MKKERLPELISEIKDELSLLDQVVQDIARVQAERPAEPSRAAVYDESLALKLHNFYTGCERMFERVASDIDGDLPRSPDWHKRLLRVMALEIENTRPAVVSKDTANLLTEFLAFRHVVRNIYGFAIDSSRLDRLVARVGPAFERVRRELEAFLEFLRAMR